MPDRRLLRVRFWLVLGAAVGAGGLILLVNHRSQQPALGPLSWTAAAVGVGLAATTLVLLVLGLGPARWINGVRDRFTGLVEDSSQRRAPIRPGTALVLFSLAAGSYAVVMARFVPLNFVPKLDQIEYLELGADIRQNGGPAGLVARMAKGDYAEANRHPLFPALLALLPGIEEPERAFEPAKWLSAAIGLIAMGVLSYGVARRFGSAVAAVMAVLLATNFAFAHETALVACEGLLVLWSGLVWLTALETESRPQSTRDLESTDSSRWTWVVLGLWSALAYLTKGSGLLLLIGIALWDVLARRRADPHRHNAPAIWIRWGLCLLSFTVVASPLLVRNARLYGNPLYNSNVPFMFADSHKEGLARFHALPPGEAESAFEAAARYLRSHSIGQIATRLLQGTATECYIMVRALGPTPLGEPRVLVGAAILLFAVIGLTAAKGSEARLVAVWSGIFVVFFGWYVPIAAGERFVLPLLVPLLMYASVGIVRLVARFRHPENVLTWAGASWCLLWVGWTLVSEAVAERFPGLSPPPS